MEQNAVVIEHIKNPDGKEYFITRSAQGQVLNVSESVDDMSAFLREFFTKVESKVPKNE